MASRAAAAAAATAATAAATRWSVGDRWSERWVGDDDCQAAEQAGGALHAHDGALARLPTAWTAREIIPRWPCIARKARSNSTPIPGMVYSTGATKLIGLVGGPSARQVESDSDELSSKDGR
jgi:hypothetical protein